MLGFDDADLGGHVVDADDELALLVGLHSGSEYTRQLVDVGRLAGLQACDDDAACLDVDADVGGVDVIDALGTTTVGGEVSYEVEVLGHRQRVGVGGAVVAPVVEVVSAVGRSIDDSLRTGAGGHGEDLHGALLFIGRRSGEGEALLLYEVGEITPA